jgi:glycosyltransferase involved in cell wall biosynthesis
MGGIETALSDLARTLSAAGVSIMRRSEPTEAEIADVQLVHFHGLWETGHHAVRKWCRARKVPYLVSPHGMLEAWAFRHRAWKKWPYFYLRERTALAQSAAILATSDEEAARLGRWFPPELIRVIPLGATPPPISNYISARQKLGWSAATETVVFLSRCHEKKGLHLLIDALPIAAAKHSGPIHLVIVGDGDSTYVQPLKRLTATWQGNVQATWVGARWGKEKWDYLSAADLMCLPSFSENFGLAVLESLFAGTPVLTTPQTPWRSLGRGLPIAFAEPSVTDLSRALAEQLAKAPPTEAERAATSAATSARFDWSVLAPRYADLYRELARA